jgi:thymidylate kinase
MFEKKPVIFKSPDMTKLQEVVIDLKTKIYIALDADPEEARSRYRARIEAKNRLLISPKKTVVSN